MLENTEAKAPTERTTGKLSPEKLTEEKAPYWLSLEQWNQDPLYEELSTTEFLSSPIRDGETTEENAIERRDFLKLMGASIALASGTGCIRRPVQKIVPYNKQPEEVVLGMPQFYTSTWVDGIEPLGLIVRTREGRPIKLEGNPDYPTNQGGLLPRAHAQLLALYDPDRLRGPRQHLFNKERTNFEFISADYEKLDDEVVAQLNKGGVALLTGELVGPAERALVQDFSQAFGAKHFVWDPAAQDAQTQANQEAFGEPGLPLPRFDLARLIISVDCDFLGTWQMPTAFHRQFSLGRRDPANMSRLVSFDSAFSLTGANADVRFKIKPSDQVAVVMGLAYELIVARRLSRFAGQAEVVRSLAPYAGVASRLGITEAQWKRLGDDLAANQGRALVVAGGAQTETPWAKALFLAVNLLNSALEADGASLFPEAAVIRQATSSLAELEALIEKGEVKSLIIHRANPVHSAVGGAKFVQVLKQVELVIYTGDRVDETARQAHLIVPDHHPMETWSDVEMVTGLVSIQQPTIRPLYNTRSFALSLMTWAYLADKGPKRLLENESYYDYLRAVWRDSVYPRFRSQFSSFDAFWDHLLQTGFAGQLPTRGQRSRVFRVASLAGITTPQTSERELVAYPAYLFHHGSLSNVSWLHELPDPVTKITWDHYVMISLKTAQDLKIKSGEMLEVSVAGKSFVLPAQVQPGLSDQTVAVALGYGRSHAGKVGSRIGVNLAGFLGEAGLNSLSGHAVQLKKVKGYQRLASVQSHHVMEGRQLVVEATQAEFNQNPGANIKRHAVFSIWPGHKYDGNKWGMSVDLNVCTGCSACMVACQAENNIPVVGRKYVLQGREMHWMRLDRYFVGNPENAEVVWQPVMCQQCDNAPCETVCPVLATVHNSEGMNDMVYNRCVGTRYCANNCPYKVRRFNWFHFTKNIQKPLHLALNPDVTVRTRGVMEKCTFCVHRIKNTKIQFRVEQKELKDGDIKTACQETCPTGAIVFGDLNDENSQISKIVRSDARAYALLEEVNAAPNVRYLTKIRNNGEAQRFQKKQKSEVQKGETV